MVFEEEEEQGEEKIIENASVLYANSAYKSKLSSDEKDLLTKCIDYYKDIYPKQSLTRDLLVFPNKLTKIIQFLYKFQNIYLKRSKKEDFNESSDQSINKPMNLEKALQLVKLPSFKSNKTITLSKKQIYKTSLRTHELELIEFCEDYYKGFYPEIFMKEKLQNYSYSLQPIIRYLYEK